MALAGIIVAGGRGTRFGSPRKCVPLLARLAAELRAAGCTRVIVAGDHDGLAPRDCIQVQDARPGCGPLGGILAGLRAATDCAAAVILAGDHLNLGARQLRRMIGSWRRDGRARWAWAGGRPRPQPLCGIMPLAGLPTAEAALAAKRLGVHRLWRAVRALPVWFPSQAPFADLDRLSDIALGRWGRRARILSNPASAP